jgi:hypothetical protein
VVRRGRPGDLLHDRPRLLFDASAYESSAFHQEYDVAPDGRFLMVREHDLPEGAERELVWVGNWLEELKAKMER